MWKLQKSTRLGTCYEDFTCHDQYFKNKLEEFHALTSNFCSFSNEPRHEKTGFLPMRKQRRRSASQ